SKVLTFFVNHAPQLQRNQQLFTPKPGAVFASRTVTLNPIGTDDDAFDPTIFSAVGGRRDRNLLILRWKIAVLGKFAGTTRDTCWIEPHDFNSANSVTFRIDDMIAPGPIVVRIRLCDCAQCDALPGTPTCPFVGREASPGQGTCVDADFPCTLLPPAPNGVIGAAGGTPPPPGSANDPRTRDP